jgi:hypothetical protein
MIKNCYGCDRFYKGSKLNKNNKKSAAMFCKFSETKGKFIWWGRHSDCIPDWCPKQSERV